jgi:hypothetical protein
MSAGIVDTKGKAETPADSKGKAETPADSKGKAETPADSKGKAETPADSKGKAENPADSKGKAETPVDSKGKADLLCDAEDEMMINGIASGLSKQRNLCAEEYDLAQKLCHKYVWKRLLSSLKSSAYSLGVVSSKIKGGEIRLGLVPTYEDACADLKMESFTRVDYLNSVNIAKEKIAKMLPECHINIERDESDTIHRDYFYSACPAAPFRHWWRATIAPVPGYTG